MQKRLDEEAKANAEHEARSHMQSCIRRARSNARAAMTEAQAGYNSPRNHAARATLTVSLLFCN